MAEVFQHTADVPTVFGAPELRGTAGIGPNLKKHSIPVIILDRSTVAISILHHLLLSASEVVLELSEDLVAVPKDLSLTIRLRVISGTHSECGAMELEQLLPKGTSEDGIAIVNNRARNPI
ncbi:hypothetical protein AKJ16_DCAP13047 [Drosera capensis]